MFKLSFIHLKQNLQVVKAVLCTPTMWSLLRALVKFAERHPTIRRLVIRSCGAVYQVQRDLPALISEDHPLNMAAGAPQWVRDRVEADFTACARMGLSTLQVVVLRMAEILAAGCGSQMYDYLESSICFDRLDSIRCLTFCR